MATTTLLIKSSKEENGPYKITVTSNGDISTIKCNCQAGKFGQYCKHKMRVIKGHEEILYDESQADDLESVVELFQKEEFIKIRSEMTKAEVALEEAEKKIKLIRQKIAQAMKNGI